MKNSLLDPFKESVLFAGLSPDDLRALSPLFSQKEMAEGTAVFVENMPGESLYLIRHGSIQISKMMLDGTEKTLIVLGPEDAFGEMALIDGEVRSATARVAEKVQLLILGKGEFEAFCEENPRVGLTLLRNIVRIFSRRLRENKEEYQEMLIWALGGKA